MSLISMTGALKIVNRSEWVKQIKRAMRQTHGRISEAAEILNVSERQLFRWLKEDEFADVERAATGVRRPGGQRGFLKGEKPLPKEAEVQYPSRRQARRQAS